MSEMTIEERYRTAAKLVLEIRGQLERLEAGDDVDLIAGGRLSASINALSRHADSLERSVVAGGSFSSDQQQQQQQRAELWRIRVRQLCEECASLRASMFEYMRRRDRTAREAEERALLLEGRLPAEKQAKLHSRTHALAAEAAALGRADAVADDIEAHGGAILGALQQQQALVAGMRRKMGDFLATLGLSRSVMRAFARRAASDRRLLFALMALTLFVIFFLFFYVKR